ncbi:pilus assembly protein PilZ [Exiguobacterium sp. KRL4]|uniref:PilZ domain-containing protein n=1 Tax=Exiguobacterium sp. KRL4 TaxID=1914536 RepID=UPI0008F80EA2|nr:PilZ domain-containing protein [Exiguobacterium sp. KRL4]OIN68026.1 pilus assembly protein PilZ [Exiguobacterium sp. KRL4]
MKIKRNESFRYHFDEPITGEFYLVKEGRRTPAGLMEIHNISPSGIAIATPLKLPIDRSTSIVVEFSLLLGSEPLNVSGQILHEKWTEAQRLYGVRLDTTKEDQQRIIEAIKQIVKEKP